MDVISPPFSFPWNTFALPLGDDIKTQPAWSSLIAPTQKNDELDCSAQGLLRPLAALLIGDSNVGLILLPKEKQGDSKALLSKYLSTP